MKKIKSKKYTDEYIAYEKRTRKIAIIIRLVIMGLLLINTLPIYFGMYNMSFDSTKNSQWMTGIFQILIIFMSVFIYAVIGMMMFASIIDIILTLLTIISSKIYVIHTFISAIIIVLNLEAFASFYVEQKMFALIGFLVLNSNFIFYWTRMKIYKKNNYIFDIESCVDDCNEDDIIDDN